MILMSLPVWVGPARTGTTGRPNWCGTCLGVSIAEEDGRPIGFVQLIEASEEESHYWVDVEPGTWALDIWIGSPEDRGRGLGAQVMRAAIARTFEHPGAHTVVIDPKVSNRRAIAFYERLGFEAVGERDFDGDSCLVMRLAPTPPT